MKPGKEKMEKKQTGQVEKRNKLDFTKIKMPLCHRIEKFIMGSIFCLPYTASS